MIDVLKRFATDDRATTAIEYALIAAGISITIIVAVNAMGTSVRERFEEVSTKLSTVGN
ncbi:Flp family type IVb pilin [Rhodoplanes sp. TEM]|uniref:Flp family type IVb pilin n=1 Tax=Rhodoplanes tepidamans TaxID=200616 RepID=A0ABT5J7Z6_RHOTP|nr:MULTISPECIES: Flp family type IVb pilin [Rhodoplanes]MDC7785759.1 Flp family type IVb pilin [Rhodoplanes tepidamans]MDC7984026.1 Flp family type IVb pilin [Rhodoplanes sp. TEM]MDQ0354679.1 pilus assembly protein Flp/PilA [Rhodoplanes tepidamans]